ncbi:MAG: nuclear transport factor 2 family protein [Planctomycetota bacterium]
MEVAKRLVELCNQNQWREATEELYADDAVSVEPVAMGPDGPQTSGKDAILKAADSWDAAHEIHSSSASGPWPHGERFIAKFDLDVTAKEGPMAGQRMKMDEMALYTVKDGKISRVEFFYDMGE